jgi:hypothetical protein
MRTDQLEKLIRACLAKFYARRIGALESLNLSEVLRRKNPYLFRAKGIGNAAEMVSELLAAHISSSDETIFGSEFFEPICKHASKFVIAAARGSDFVLEADDAYQAISLKSGPNAFNSDQVSKLNDRFREIEDSLRATLRTLRKQFVPIMGCAYGKGNLAPQKSRRYFKLAGQEFWERVTGDSAFYLKLVSLMRDDPDKHRPAFTEAWDRAVNRFVRDFTAAFCNDIGEIEWERLVAFNSGRREARTVPKLSRK